MASLILMVGVLVGASRAEAQPASLSHPMYEAAAFRAGAVAPASVRLARPGVWPAKAAGQRSVGLAFGLSAVVPGAGQAYNQQWVKAGVAIAAEALIITSGIVWRRQGLDLEDDYINYAHGFWEPTKYASWLNDYSQFIQSTLQANVTAPPVAIPTGIDFTRPEQWTDAEWQQVDAFFGQIQTLERQMFHVETRAAFSHTLPDFSEQQYYELVGKYYQFAPGWEDYPEWIVGGEYRPAIDPSQTAADGSKPNVSPRFFQYSDDHAHANDVLRRASRVSMLLVVTHLVSAFEAAISAKLHNDRLAPTLGFAMSPEGQVRPVATLSYRLGL
ncbi:MAG: hypothetical protein SH809_14655 [Rhodothermales bacterium]|nr:hypothetical protein [Rhodothermales bacterium]